MPRNPEWARFPAPGPVSSQVSTAARSCAGFTRWQGHHTVLMADFTDHHFVRHRPQTQYRLRSNLRSQHHQAVFKPWLIAAPGCVQTLGHSSPRLCSNLGSQQPQVVFKPWVTAAPGCVQTLGHSSPRLCSNLGSQQPQAVVTRCWPSLARVLIG